ncbi:MAG: hypothetical protein HQM10_22230 [Candidatus Riflebacteria bacterium]|nr:hypothetical protein [Candidatus Riflebacteria bacterium]
MKEKREACSPSFVASQVYFFLFVLIIMFLLSGYRPPPDEWLSCRARASSLQGALECWAVESDNLVASAVSSVTREIDFNIFSESEKKRVFNSPWPKCEYRCDPYDTVFCLQHGYPREPYGLSLREQFIKNCPPGLNVNDYKIDFSKYKVHPSLVFPNKQLNLILKHWFIVFPLLFFLFSVLVNYIFLGRKVFSIPGFYLTFSLMTSISNSAIIYDSYFSSRRAGMGLYAYKTLDLLGSVILSWGFFWFFLSLIQIFFGKVANLCRHAKLYLVFPLFAFLPFFIPLFGIISFFYTVYVIRDYGKSQNQ